MWASAPIRSSALRTCGAANGIASTGDGSLGAEPVRELLRTHQHHKSGGRHSDHPLPHERPAMPLDEIAVGIHLVGAVHREIQRGNFREPHQRDPERAGQPFGGSGGWDPPHFQAGPHAFSENSRTNPAAARPVPSPITMPGFAHEAARTAISQVFNSREKIPTVEWNE